MALKNTRCNCQRMVGSRNTLCTNGLLLGKHSVNSIFVPSLDVFLVSSGYWPLNSESKSQRRRSFVHDVLDGVLRYTCKTQSTIEFNKFGEIRMTEGVFFKDEQQ